MKGKKEQRGGRKKPLSPKVLALNEQLARKRGVRDLIKRFLIVCEDGKSAVNYFNALKKHLHLSATSIQVYGSGGRTQPEQVVSRALEIKKATESNESGTLPFEHIWCVIDGDYGDKIANARLMAQANGIKLAITTVCFEYWILLHFADHDKSSNECDEVVSILKNEHLPSYTKGGFDFSAIVTNYAEAAKRARRLRRKNELPEHQNPCSDLYLLMDDIQRA